MTGDIKNLRFLNKCFKHQDVIFHFAGDADLYVRKGVEEASTSNYDCRSWNVDANETCSMGDYPKGGIYNILVSRYSDYVNYHLTAEYKEYDLDF